MFSNPTITTTLAPCTIPPMGSRTDVPSARHKPTTPLDVSIVLATYHRPKSLKNTLNSFCRLIDTEIQWEVIVIDNGNDHETAEVARQFKEKLPLTFLTESQTGKSHALNSAIPRQVITVLTDCIVGLYRPIHTSVHLSR